MQLLQRLKDMGFTSEQVTTALRSTNNNYEAAAAWLLGDRDGSDVYQTYFLIVIYLE